MKRWLLLMIGVGTVLVAVELFLVFGPHFLLLDVHQTARGKAEIRVSGAGVQPVPQLPGRTFRLVRLPPGDTGVHVFCRQGPVGREEANIYLHDVSSHYVRLTLKGCSVTGQQVVSAL